MQPRASSQESLFASGAPAKDRKSSLIERKVWLPRALYDALPWFYLVSGIAALLATLYISSWFWVLPHYFLFSAACLHLSVLVFRRRWSRKSESVENSADT